MKSLYICLFKPHTYIVWGVYLVNYASQRNSNVKWYSWSLS
jgi:hypothetical protein